MSARTETVAHPRSLRDTLAGAADLTSRRLFGLAGETTLADLVRGRRLSGGPAAVRGRSVLVRVSDPFHAAAALVELDGTARRIVLCPPDLSQEHLAAAVRQSEADAVVSDAPALAVDGLALALIGPPGELGTGPPEVATEWVMFTSGTSGNPKLAVHTLAGLAGAIRPVAGAHSPVWGTFYDIRRYGGLQVLLRALIGGGSIVISAPEEPLAGFLARVVGAGVTHLTGTPSHWRRALMSPAAAALAPRYVRLSGEVADQGVLDALRARFPGVPVAHAYASTEAGVGFEVGDGREGFPAALVEDRAAEVAMRVVGGALQIRSPRTAIGYLDGAPLRDAAGWVDTGDVVERRGDRYHFVGRRTGVINIGGLKAHPEEIEAAINQHPAVSMSRARARRSPITGAIVVADVVLAEGAETGDGLRADILAHCRRLLPAHKSPAFLAFVPALPLTAAGKLERLGA